MKSGVPRRAVVFGAAGSPGISSRAAKLRWLSVVGTVRSRPPGLPSGA